MAVIDRDKVVNNVLFYLGDANCLSPDMILDICNSVILKMEEDDEKYYPDVLCLTLKNTAIQNKAMATLNTGRGVRREKSNNREIEFFNGNATEYWDEFLTALPDLCSSFGSCCLASRSAGMTYFNVSRPVTPPTSSDFYKMRYPENCDGNN